MYALRFIKCISAFTLFFAFLFLYLKLEANIQLRDVMSSNEEQKTGVYMLSPAQKQELEKWINEKFTLKASNPTSTPIYLQQNIQNGSQLQLTDGSLYEIAPSDQSKTAYWITPIPIKISSSSDPQYPVLLTNTLTGMSVQARLISTPSKTP